MGNLVFGSAERSDNSTDAAEIPVVRDNDVAIGQGPRRQAYRKTRKGHGDSTSQYASFAFS